MQLARRTQFAVLVGLLHAGLIAVLLLQRAPLTVPRIVPAFASLDLDTLPSEATRPPELPVTMQLPVPEIVQPELRYPEEVASAAITVEARPLAVVAASQAAVDGAQPRLVSNADYLHPLQLAYPRAAKRRRAQGMVLVYVLIDGQGLPRTVRLYKSSGDGDLDQAAVRAVGNAQFRPQSVNGIAEPVQVIVPVNFFLTESR